MVQLKQVKTAIHEGLWPINRASADPDRQMVHFPLTCWYGPFTMVVSLLILHVAFIGQIVDSKGAIISIG